MLAIVGTLLAGILLLLAIVVILVVSLRKMNDALNSPPRDQPSELANAEVDGVMMGSCPNCNARIPISSHECSHCTAVFGDGAAWKVKRF